MATSLRRSCGSSIWLGGLVIDILEGPATRSAALSVTLPPAVDRGEGGQSAFAVPQPGRSADGIRWALEWVQVARCTVTRTFAIITTDANKAVAELHDRMPVTLELQDWPTWWARSKAIPPHCLQSAGDDVPKVWPVSKMMTRNNGCGVVAVTSFRPTVWRKACRRQDTSCHRTVERRARRGAESPAIMGSTAAGDKHWSPHLDRARGKGRVRRA